MASPASPSPTPSRTRATSSPTRAGNETDTFTAQAVTNDTPDGAAPTVTSIARQSPTTSPTNADTLTWRVTFSENVKNVDMADFSAGGTTATVTAVSTVTASTVYDVTASGGNLAGLNGTVTLGFASDQDIKDTAGNALTNTTPTGTSENTYVVDNTAPAFSSAALDATTLTVTFSEALATAAPANAAFMVKKGADTLALTGAPSVSGAEVTLTLSAAAAHGESGFTVAYAKPSSGNKLADRAGNEADTFTAQAVTNEYPGRGGPDG